MGGAACPAHPRNGARIGSRPASVLVALCIANALITFALMDYIHVNGGAPGGAYGKSYAKQLQDGSGPQSQPGNPD